jgi:DNA modification methylase
MQIVRSIEVYGFNDPLAIDENNTVIEGHGRLLAVKELGYEAVPCIRLSHLSESQKRAYILAHNKLTMNSGFDTQLLIDELVFLKDEDFNVELTGFDLSEVEKILSKGAEVKEDDFDIDAELKNSPITKQGDIWELGKHRVICGDSTKPETYERLMHGVKANLILTDPPYGVDYEGAGGKIQNDKFSSDMAFENFLISAFTNARDNLAVDGSAYVFHADVKGLSFRKAFDTAGFNTAACCVWSKNTFTFGRSDYQWQHEPCLFGWRKDGKHLFYGDRKQSTIWNCDKPLKSKDHPTTKPLKLLEIPLRNSTQTNGVVLEPFGGSGSTLICAEMLDRICYCIEIDEKFVDIIVKRYIETVGSADSVTLERNGEKRRYAEVVNET